MIGIFSCFFYFNFFTAMISVCFWLMKVILKDILVVGRFLYLDILLFTFSLVKIVHFLYVKICLKILFNGLSEAIMCIDNTEKLMQLMIASLSAGETMYCFPCLSRLEMVWKFNTTAEKGLKLKVR